MAQAYMCRNGITRVVYPDYSDTVIFICAVLSKLILAISRWSIFDVERK